MESPVCALLAQCHPYAQAHPQETFAREHEESWEKILKHYCWRQQTGNHLNVHPEENYDIFIHTTEYYPLGKIFKLELQQRWFSQINVKFKKKTSHGTYYCMIGIYTNFKRIQNYKECCLAIHVLSKTTIFFKRQEK